MVEESQPPPHDQICGCCCTTSGTGCLLRPELAAFLQQAAPGTREEMSARIVESTRMLIGWRMLEDEARRSA